MIQPGCSSPWISAVWEGLLLRHDPHRGGGSAHREMERVYHTVLEAQQAGDRRRPGRAGPGREIDAAAGQVIPEAGYGEAFSHSFGHSLGLEIHESPNAAPGEERIMPVGAVVSAEPGIYLPGRFGVRIEDVPGTA